MSDIMKKIKIVQLGKPGHSWQAWIKALVNDGFIVNTVTPMTMELLAVYAGPGDIILFDGMLPNLTRFIERSSAGSPGARIIVATEVDSFTIKYEVMHLHDVIYISGPMKPDRFVQAISATVSHGCESAA